MRRLELGLTLSSLLCLPLIACDKSGDPSTTPDANTKAEADAGSGHATHAQGELANASMVAELHAGSAPNTAGVLRSSHQGQSSYDVNAPATVLITTRWGHGSGVIIDPKGLVLTNYHVVEGGEREDFTIEVGVTTAKIDSHGSAEPDKELRAVALKVDPKRDLALLRVVDLDADLPTAPLAPAERPSPGRAVSAIGNAGVGFGWAVKHCNINAIGTLENAVEAIFGAQAEALAEDQREKIMAAMKAAAKDAGLQIQTDCTVLPGDSGGPLIDEQTHEVIGLNAAVRTSTKGFHSVGTVSFHIHVAEIHDFLADVPEQPGQFAPDPWEIAGHHALIDDTDKDGEVDSLLMGGTCGSEHLQCHVIFVDMDQDSFTGVAELPELQSLYDDRAFEAEWAMFLRPRMPRGGHFGDHLAPVADTMFYFDGDRDGRFDGLVVDDAETGASRGYRLAATGAVTRDESLDGTMENPESLFEGDSDRDHFNHFRAAIEIGTHATSVERTAALDVALRDFDRDGKSDTAIVETRLDDRIFIDADQDSLVELDAAALTRALAEGRVDAEIVAVDSTPYRVWYDTDSDGRMDLMLEGLGPGHDWAIDAAIIDAKGQRQPAPEHIGRHLLRADLIGTGEVAKAAQAMATAVFAHQVADPSDRRGTFPDPTPGPVFMYEVYEDSKDGVVFVSEPERAMLLVDLDRNTRKLKANKDKKIEAILRDGGFEAEFVFMFDGVLAWAFYDEDDDGDFDQVWITGGDDPRHPHHVFTLGDTVTRSDPAPSATMFEASVFKTKKLRKSFEAARKLVVEE